jgi:hypothetical protein
MGTVEDRWWNTVQGERRPRERCGRGLRWRARYRDAEGRQRSRSFAREPDAVRFLTLVQADLLRGSHIDPGRSRTALSVFAVVQCGGRDGRRDGGDWAELEAGLVRAGGPGLRVEAGQRPAREESAISNSAPVNDENVRVRLRRPRPLDAGPRTHATTSSLPMSIPAQRSINTSTAASSSSIR